MVLAGSNFGMKTALLCGLMYLTLFNVVCLNFTDDVDRWTVTQSAKHVATAGGVGGGIDGKRSASSPSDAIIRY